MSAWSHLPNAAHIGRVIESLKTHPEIWVAAWDAARIAAREAARDAAWIAAWSAGRVAAWSAGRVAARVAAWYAAWSAARVAARDSASDAAWDAGRDAIAALVAWDDSTEFLDMTGDELEVWARLSDDPRAVLLLPAVRAFEKIAILETV